MHASIIAGKIKARIFPKNIFFQHTLKRKKIKFPAVRNTSSNVEKTLKKALTHRSGQKDPHGEKIQKFHIFIFFFSIKLISLLVEVLDLV